ncbi:flagellar protein FliT [Allopusillimonas ginsengisoli]|uniref:flagellar protein FliT n=1 Tax=Allopusillimonas ginsengisoli TaxID=453575 RepID=UPI001431489D|nr:flagellar protein FliT [Allopusillimonas ginsengisoli]
MIDSLISHYRAVEEISRRMLDAARAGDWVQVLALFELYTQSVEHLRQHKGLSDKDRIARRDLITRILENDANIRILVAPELARLGKQIGRLKQGQSMLAAYYRRATPL